MNNCIFCKMASGEIKPSIAYEDKDVLAFHDINPQAPIHVLIIPRRHISTLNDVDANSQELLGHMLVTATKLAQSLKIAPSGYRVVINCNADGGQSVYHVHVHLLGGRAMSWPPG